MASAVSEILDLTDGNEIFVSVVSKGKLWSIAKQSNWGASRQGNLSNLLSDYQRADINDAIIEPYADIDAFSQGKLRGRSLRLSPRNMGKNDLWIGASASLAGGPLITTDNDFNHLHGQFDEVVRLGPNLYK